MKKKTDTQFYSIRHMLVVAGVVVVVGLLAWRAVFLHVSESDFLQVQGETRHARIVKVDAHRGMILDRHSKPLAISTKMDESIWVDPQKFGPFRSRWTEVDRALGTSAGTVDEILSVGKRMETQFVYLARNVSAGTAEKVRALKAGTSPINGIYVKQGYKRFYPSGEISAHVVGFTGVDDQGLEGIERSLEVDLAAQPGKKRVVQDERRRHVEIVERLQEASYGGDVHLTIDKRLQYLLYRELKAVTKRHSANSASAVILDAQSGEILAMASQPSFNPNISTQRIPGRVRNRAIADLFEPGSTMKPFTIAAALESGQYDSDSTVDTQPGSVKIGRYTIRDKRDNGVLSLSEIIEKSSNVGASRIALSLDSDEIWRIYDGVGFGVATGVEFFGEASGRLNPHWAWSDIEKVTVSYGYGVSTTALQLARAYCLFSSGGFLPDVSIRHDRHGNNTSAREKIISRETASAVTQMLERVVNDGTGKTAAIPGYRVAGKTGTVHKLTSRGYDKGRYLALFAGFAPVSEPRFVMVVMVDDPMSGRFYGGEVAAPVFSKVIGGALRLYDVKPDAPRLLNVDSGQGHGGSAA